MVALFRRETFGAARFHTPHARDRLFPFLVLAVLALDIITKVYVSKRFAVGDSVSLVPGVVSLTRIENAGAAFGILQGKIWLFVIVSLVVVAGLWLYNKTHHGWLSQTASALVIAGALGNLLSRLISGTVTDFINLGWWPAFNIADTALTVGVLLFIWMSARGEKHNQRAYH